MIFFPFSFFQKTGFSLYTNNSTESEQKVEENVAMLNIHTRFLERLELARNLVALMISLRDLSGDTFGAHIAPEETLDVLLDECEARLGLLVIDVRENNGLPF